MKLKIILILIFLLSIRIHSQNEYITADHPVYHFLKELSVKGALENYKDVIIPLPKREIIQFLKSVKDKKELLTYSESELLDKYLERFNPGLATVSIFGDRPDDLFSASEKKLYFYQDSIAFLSIMPVIDLGAVYSNKSDRTAFLLNFGGKASGSYSSWLGFSVRASNGIVKGDRISALEDERVSRSFTFNNTRINYFDETSGHLALHSGILDLQFGRERILWGAGSITKMVLSDNPPSFDLLRLKLAYKSLSYEYLHGWLVQKPFAIYSDPAAEQIESKNPKYIALNRLGFSPSEILNMGISQIIIYSSRPLEAAYFNPFLLWESAQRSLNDLDNSFLVLDSEIKPLKGLSVSGTYLFDDINFNFFDDWNNISNRSAWQISSILTSPLFLNDFALKVDYSQVRPYTFSHVGEGEALTYTNNGYMLGYPYNPNSGLLSLLMNFRATGNMNFGLTYDYLLHGINREGDLIKNFGGDVLSYYRDFDSNKPKLFDGNLERTYIIGFTFDYEFLTNYFVTFNARTNLFRSADDDESLNTFSISLKLLNE